MDLISTATTIITITAFTTVNFKTLKCIGLYMYRVKIKLSTSN